MLGEQEKQQQQQDQKIDREMIDVVVEVGTGTGLVSLALAKAGTYANRIIATDYEPITLELTSYACQEFLTMDCNKNDGDDDDESTNPRHVVETKLFDLCDFNSTLLSLMTPSSQRNQLEPPPQSDSSVVETDPSRRAPSGKMLLVAADIMYEPTTGRAMARRVGEALRLGFRVVIGDSPGRAGRPAFLEELKQLLNNVPEHYLEFRDVVGRTCVGERHDLICGENSTSVTRPSTGSFDDYTNADYRELSVAILDLDPSILSQY